MAIAVLVTIPQNKAEKLAKKLLKEHVCACVNILNGVRSFFRWEGKIDTSKESIMIIKTKKNLFEKLKKTITENHPYDTPEIIGFEIDKINKKYLDWLKKETCG